MFSRNVFQKNMSTLLKFLTGNKNYGISKKTSHVPFNCQNEIYTWFLKNYPVASNSKTVATYVWIDGTGEFLRCKDRVLVCDPQKPEDFPTWDYDGSSTYQSQGSNSDTYLCPVAVYNDPFLPGSNKLVLCDTYKHDGTPTETNKRQACLRALEKTAAEKPWFGIEQEYTLMDKNGYPYGWPIGGQPSPQGPYYCGVGAGKVLGRRISIAHLLACMFAGINISGTNSEVMLSQWEYQIGPNAGISAADDLWISRFILHRIAEEFDAVVSLDPKPMTGDWNGAGAHCNMSTEKMREENGIVEIKKAIKKLSKHQTRHIQAYDPKRGEDNKRRLTGKHETASIENFSSGVADRGVSVRIPRRVDAAKKGYFEDRRPSANCDPYSVIEALVRTVILEEQ